MILEGGEIGTVIMIFKELYVLESHTDTLARKCCHIGDLNQGVARMLGCG